MTADEELRLAKHEECYWWHVVKRRYLAAILHRYSALPTARAPLVLDIGAGTGASREIFPSGTRLVLAEPGLNATLAAAAGGLRVVCVAELLPFRADTFDVVLAADVLEHIDAHHQAARDITRVLRPGGYFLMTVPAYPTLFSAHDEALGHFRRYTWHTLHAVITAAGLQPVFSTALFGSLLPGVLLRRWLSPPGSPQPQSSYVEVPAWLNRLCIGWFGLEAAWLRIGRLPVGSSLCVLARKAVAQRT
jgi:SAM-dependent methyltransferase